METMLVTCPECGTKMKVPESSFGKKVRCKKCEEVFPVKPPRKAAAVKDDDDDDGDPKPAPARAIQSAKSVKPPKPGKGGKPDKPPAKGDKAGKPPPETIPLAGEDDPSDDGKAYGLTDDVLGYRCPQCAADMESEDAIICLQCGFNTQTRGRTATLRTKETTGGDKFLWLLPGILCIVGILAMIGYWFFHHFALVDMLVDDWDGLLDRAKDSRKDALDDEAAPWYGTFFKPWFELWLAIFFMFLTFFAGKFAVKRLILHPNPPEIELR